MTTVTAWGLNSDGHPKTVYEAVEERIEAVIAEHINTRLAIAAATGLDAKTIDQIRHLHLAEPWLPATEATQMLEAAMLLVPDPHYGPGGGLHDR